MNKISITLLVLIAALLSCTYTQKIRDGKMAYERKQFAVATKLLKKEFDKAKSRIEKGKIAFIMGESYRELNQSDASINWYQIAYDNQYGVDALKEYAYALKKAQRYKEAKQAFKDLGIEIGSPYEYRREISACDIALGWIADNKYAKYKVSVTQFNTGAAEYAPTPYLDNSLVFTSDRPASTGEESYNWTGKDFSDLFLVDLSSNDVSSFDPAFNTPDNEGTITFNKSYTEAYFTRCYGGGKRGDSFCKIMVSEKQGDSWSIPRNLGFIENEVNYGHPSISDDGNFLYFSCNHPDGWGGYDIYVSERSPDGWGEPKIMGRSINTIGNEKFPTADADTLYFSSDFHTGMGGLDIFKSYKYRNNTWSPAYNLKPPINSGGDDFGYVIDYNAPKRDKKVLQVGYFSSTRVEGIGGDDIYRYEKVIPPPRPKKPKKKEIVYKMVLNGYVLEKIYDDPTNPNSKVLGRKPLEGAKVKIQIGKKTEEVTVGEDGLFSLEVEEETDYDFLASKENYLNNVAKFSSKGIGKDPNNPTQTFEVEIVLDKIFRDKEIRLENIYYDFDKWDIREDARPTLDALADNLRINPNIRIQLGSHTDCQGNPRYNEDLSQRRAQSAVDYLISKGISPERLTAKGFGENVLEIQCICTRCTEEEHQSNRRTTFKIIE